MVRMYMCMLQQKFKLQCTCSNNYNNNIAKTFVIHWPEVTLFLQLLQSLTDIPKMPIPVPLVASVSSTELKCYNVNTWLFCSVMLHQQMMDR